MKNGNIVKFAEINLVQKCVKDYIYFLWINFFTSQKSKHAFVAQIHFKARGTNVNS